MTGVRYSPLCDTDLLAYVSYLVCHGGKIEDAGAGEDDGQRSEVNDDRLVARGLSLVDALGRVADFGSRLAASGRVGREVGSDMAVGQGVVSHGERVVCDGDQGGSNIGGDDSGVAAGDRSEFEVCGSRAGAWGTVKPSAGDTSRDQLGVDCGVAGASGSCGAGDGVRLPTVRGVNYNRNHRWREAKKKQRVDERERGALRKDWRVPEVAGRSADVSCGVSDGSVGKCWTVREESDMEKRIREALEKKRAIEAELAARKAELALKRMNDVVLTELYDNRVKQEGICKMNQAIVKSEKSLENLKSVSPGSSATPGEIREALLNSEKWKCKEKKIRAWAASGHADSGIVEILDDDEDGGSLDEYTRMLAVEIQDESDRQVELGRMWKNAYKTDDEIAAQENKVKAQYDVRVLGKIAGMRVAGKAARDEEAAVRKAQSACDLGMAKIKDLEAQMLRSC